MGSPKDNETKTILKKLAIFVVAFYVIYYLASIIFVGSFDVDWNDLGKFPFRIDKYEFNPGDGGGALGAWLAMVLTYCCSLGLTYFVVKATRKSWDYVATASVFHFVLCCIVNQDFPTNWIWWVTILLASALLSGVAEVMNYYLIDMRDIETGN
eukprot:gene21347-28282_t